MAVLTLSCRSNLTVGRAVPSACESCLMELHKHINRRRIRIGSMRNTTTVADLVHRLAMIRIVGRRIGGNVKSLTLQMISQTNSRQELVTIMPALAMIDLATVALQRRTLAVTRYTVQSAK